MSDVSVARLRPPSPFALLWLFAWIAAVFTLDPLSQIASLAPWLAFQPAPATTDPATSAPPFFLHASKVDYDRAVRCLTDAIYYEAATEPVEGQRAVAQVVINRVRDPNFPKSVCGVVYQGWQRRTGCQFSFVCDGSIRRRHAIPALWNQLRPIAEQALNGYVATGVGAATHYYATFAPPPAWLSSVRPVGQFGSQKFFAWKGRAGQPSALTAAYQGEELKVGDAVLDGRAEPWGQPVTRLKRHTGRLRLADNRPEGARA